MHVCVCFASPAATRPQLRVTAALDLSRLLAEQKEEEGEKQGRKVRKQREWVAQMFSHKRWREKVTRDMSATFSNAIAQPHLHTPTLRI